MKKITIVLSCYNEKNCILEFYNQIINIVDNNYIYELLYIDDGSYDGTSEELNKIKNNNIIENVKIKIIKFSKNFGHEAAMLCGIDYAEGDFVIFMDGDGQHPINKVREIVELLENDTDIVMMVREKYVGKSLLSNLFSSLFYKIINKFSNANFLENASDFFALNKKVVYYLRNNYREKVRFLRGIVQNVGFRKSIIKYDSLNRISGKSHYNIKKLTNLAITSIFSYSDMPLHIGIFFGLICALMGVILIIYTMFSRNGAPSGYATIIIFLCFMFSMLFILLSVIGEYIAIIFKEIKDRPIYTIEDII